MKFLKESDLPARVEEFIHGVKLGEVAIITAEGQPVIIAMPYDEQLIRHGLHTNLALNLFLEEMVDLEQAAEIAGMTQESFREIVVRENNRGSCHSSEDQKQDLKK